MSVARAIVSLGLAAAFAYAAAGCGGGGSTTPPAPQASPSMCPSPAVNYPPLDCTQYSLAGSTTQTVTRFYPNPPPPPLVTNISVQQNITVHTNKMFHGSSATDFHTLEIDTGPNQSLTITSDVYIIFPVGQNGQIINLGFHSADSNGVVLDVANTAGNGIVGEIPLPNSGGWSNNASQIISETDPDGTTTNMTVNSDGTYNLTKNEVAGQTTACDNSDGSGSANIPTSSFFAGAGSTDVGVTAPSKSNQITITLSGLAPSPVPTPLVSCVPSPNPTPTQMLVGPPIATTVPAWYSPAPVVIANDQTTIDGTTNIPAGCTALAANGTQLHEVKSSIDPVFGTTDNETNDVWVSSSMGPVCQQTSDEQDVFYDFTGQINPVIALGLLGTLTQKTQTSELLGLVSVVRSSAARQTLGIQRMARLPLGVQQALANVRLERQRILTRVRLLRALERRFQGRFLK